jgi:hypothetical protein
MVAATVLFTTASTAHAASDRVIARWDMNEWSGSRVMRDSSGHGLNGRIGGEVSTGVSGSGATGYRFGRLEPDTPPAHPGHLVTVADNDYLDPGTRDFAITVRLRTTYQFGNIIQKGQATVPGGNFKLQIPNGIVQCSFRGASRFLLVQSSRRLNDGRWHTVRCSRSRSSVALTVDGRTVARGRGWTGRISNSWPLTIGGKSSCNQVEVGCDYYAGDLDWVEINTR